MHFSNLFIYLKSLLCSPTLKLAFWYWSCLFFLLQKFTLFMQTKTCLFIVDPVHHICSCVTKTCISLPSIKFLDQNWYLVFNVDHISSCVAKFCVVLILLDHLLQKITLHTHTETYFWNIASIKKITLLTQIKNSYKSLLLLSHIVPCF